jgi:hypothetical protein
VSDVKLPAIPEPSLTNEGLLATLSALKMAIEMIAGQRGDIENAHVTFQDLVDLEIIAEDQIPTRR